jgi:hypothetical protein
VCKENWFADSDPDDCNRAAGTVNYTRYSTYSTDAYSTDAHSTDAQTTFYSRVTDIRSVG